MSYGANLVEPGVHYFFNETLKKCKEFKDKYYNLIYNVFMFACFCLLFYIILRFKYKSKNDLQEKKMNEIKKEKYILSKIKNYQSEKKMNSNIITGLPEYENEYSLIARRLYNNYH